MEKMILADLIAGMKIGKDVISKGGMKLVPKGSILSLSTIEYLRSWGVSDVYIEEEKQEIITGRKEKQKQITNTYKKSLDTTIEFLEGLKTSNQLKIKEVRNVINELNDLTEILPTIQVVNQLKQQDTYTQQHSMNVAIYSLFMGRWLNLDETTLKKLCYAALLHDIGKIRVAEDIILKPGKLTKKECQEVKKHTIYGYNIIKENPNLSHQIALGVLQHHERQDGSGYPFGIDGTKIHLFAKIIAVADIYDAITSDRTYKERQSPFIAAEVLTEQCFGILDTEIVKIFIEKLADFYIGSSVILNNGEIGQIITKNPVFPTRPLVKVGERFIDLSKERSIGIQDILIA
ncbi:HD-GYP domain-containing protein [Natronincola ferrireducens]|uniref:HDIG domain-containing protein n=1 Tax=Natronincola ferrireducens TaxID=393762 RepID=A0A1G8ZE83_9FIRM|nr:HD-GYP domain-containing protein [Natronincola ferrireducens]SDK13337.1 HDIG domain-containing protein [Natronincola ferrireducens]